MKAVCGECHASNWVDPYFVSFDNTVSDYNKMYDYTFALLNEVYEEELIDPSNPIDEVPEIEHYYIWHHSGRRWRMGAAMMAPDWTHWNGAVDALLADLNTMEDWIATARETKLLEASLMDTEANLMSTEAKLEQAMSDIEGLSQVSDNDVDEPAPMGSLLMPAAILAIGIVIAAVLVIQKDKV
jgi:hypothetical protein